MKGRIYSMFIALAIIVFPLPAQNTRLMELFNFGWKFHLGDIGGAEEVEFDDSEWRELDLPHDFQMEQPWVEEAGGARGFKTMETGWYRKSFRTDERWNDKRVLFDFEGIMYVGDVWVNGQQVARTEYGYLGFEVDVTDLLRKDSDNVVAVRAHTGEKNGSRWYTGGGLFRNVHLLVKDSISIARHGVYVSTPRITEESADVCVLIEVEGPSTKRKDVEAIARIFSPNGVQVAETRLPEVGKSNLKNVERQLPLATINNPQLWSCETPNLYTAEVTLFHEGKAIDRVTETFGIRTIEFSPKFGFKLNGKKVFLKGIANHHDLGAVGAAAFDAAIERQFIQMKNFGFNHIRCSHNPYSESFLKLADKHGLLVVDELIDKWSDDSYWGGREPFTNLWHKLIPEWIKRDRNHPCVILWSLGNELQMREDLAGFSTSDWGVTTYRIFDVLVKRYDTTRKTTVAMFPARAGAIGKNDPEFNTQILPPELATVTEVSSFNYRYKNYQDYLKAAPWMTVYQSEATTNELTAPFFGMDREHMVGLAYWGAIEYWGESNGWPKKGWNYSFFSHTLEPYPQAYLIKSAFCDNPLVHIGIIDNNESIEWNDITVGHLELSDHWNHEIGSKQNIFTYTNADEVELLLNSKSLGVKQNPRENYERRNIIYWQDIPYEEGNLTAVARTDGKEVARHVLQTAEKAVALRLVAEEPDNWQADGMDLQYIKVYAVDKKGRRVPTVSEEVIFDVTGDCKLIALDNGDHYTDELFGVDKKKMSRGFVMAVLRSGHTGGKVTVNVSAAGLKNGKITLFINDIE